LILKSAHILKTEAAKNPPLQS